jgi:hypothetical protein
LAITSEFASGTSGIWLKTVQTAVLAKAVASVDLRVVMAAGICQPTIELGFKYGAISPLIFAIRVLPS